MQDKEANKVSLLIKNIISVGFVQIANYILPLVSVPIIVRIIGPNNFGVINYFTAFTAYFVLLINYGFDYTGTRYIAVQKDNIFLRNEHFSKILYAKIFLFVVSTILFLSIIFFVAKTSDELKIAFYTFLICISGVLSPNWFYQGMQNLTSIAIFNLCAKLIYTVIILFIVNKKTDYVWQPLALSVTQILIAIVSLILAVRKYDISIVKIKFSVVSKLLWDDKLIFLTMIASNLYTDTNVVILGLYETKENIGYFTAAWKLTFIFLMIISFPLSQALFPYIAEAFSQNVEKGIKQVKRMLPIIIYFTLLCSFIMFFLGDLLIRLFYGPQFIPSVLIFKILMFVPVLSYINTILGLQTMVNLKMDKPYFFIIFLGGVFSVVFNVIIINIYGYKGCAWSWVVTEIIIALVSHFYLKKKDINLFDSSYFSYNSVLNELRLLIKKIYPKQVN